MVRESPKSARKGVNGKEVSSTWRQSRVQKKRLLKKRKVTFVLPTQRQNSENWARFYALQTDEDKLKSTAVSLLRRRLSSRCAREGVDDLLKKLSRSDKRRKPTKKGDHCIAIHQGKTQNKKFAAWEPCFFENEIFPNASADVFYIMRRTDYALLANKRLSKFFAVRSTEAFLVPSSFGEDWDLHYLPNSGVYVIQAIDTGNIYVGTSKDIQKRIHFHNCGAGATFTTGSKWFRIVPELSSSQGSLYTQESQEAFAQINKAEKNGLKIRVRGGFMCKTK